MELVTLPKVQRHLGLTDSVHATLRAAIVENHLTAGSRLTEASIAVQLGVSNTLVREAISRLEREGLVHYLPRLGQLQRVGPADGQGEGLRLPDEDLRDPQP